MNVKRSREEHPVQDYFTFDKESNKSTCNIVKCTFFASDRHWNNLAKHIQRHHTNQCAEFKNNSMDVVKELAKTRQMSTIQLKSTEKNFRMEWPAI